MDKDEEGKKSDRAQSLYKGLSILQRFSGAHSRMTLSEMAAEVGMNRATTRRFLLTLTDLGYLESDGKYYSLTPKVMTLGYNYLAGLPWWQLAKPMVEELSRELQESCSVGVLAGEQLIFVARVQGPRMVATNLTPGRSVPVHTAATGRVLLAELESAALDRLLERTPLVPLTQYTVTDPDKLKQALRVVRQQGYAIIDQELELGLRAVAVPIRDKSGRAVAALGASTQVARRSLEDLQAQILPQLLRTVSLIRDLLPQ
jgi:IclR family pca regulon transcriptional regulator